MLKKGNRIYHREHNVQAMLHMCYSLWKFKSQINLLLLRNEVKAKVPTPWVNLEFVPANVPVIYISEQNLSHIVLTFLFIAAATIPLKKKKPSFCRNEQAKTLSDSFKFFPFTSALLSQEAFLSPINLYQRDLIL